MKKIAILGDTIVSDKHYGIQRFAYEILKQLDLLIDKGQILLVVKKEQNVNVQFKNIEIVKTGFFKNSFLWRQISFVHFIKKNKLLSMDMTLGLPYLKCDIVCLHDCIYEKFKDDFIGIHSKLRRLIYLLKVKHIQKRAKKIITVSNTSKKSLSDYYKIEPNKIEVIYNAWQHMNNIVEDNAILEKLHLNKKQYVFSLGSILPHKNIEWLIENSKYNNLTYVITGDYINYNKKNTTIKLPNNVIFSGYLSDGEIKTLMKNCYAFIQPSLIEGFGIPPLEALSQGANVLVSNIPCFKEIYGEHVKYFDPMKYNYSLNDNINNYNKNELLAKYSWEQSAKKMLKILSEL